MAFAMAFADSTTGQGEDKLTPFQLIINVKNTPVEAKNCTRQSPE